MTEPKNKPRSAPPASNDDENTALFRRAEQAAQISQLLINQTAQLLEQTRQLLKNSGHVLIMK